MFENKRYLPGIKLSWYLTPKKIKEIINDNMLCKNQDDRYTSLKLIKIMNKIC
jgi:hypothetical protein